MTDLAPTPYDVPLFNADISRGTHRHNDPATSVEAAKAKDPSPDQQLALDALRANNGAGSIDDVCAFFWCRGIQRDRGTLSRRLTDLAQSGYIADTGETEMGSRGRYVTVWAVVDRG